MPNSEIRNQVTYLNLPALFHIINHCKAILPSFSLCFSLKAKWKRSLVPDVIASETVDRFQKFKQCLQSEKILHNLYKIDFECIKPI